MSGTIRYIAVFRDGDLLLDKVPVSPEEFETIRDLIGYAKTDPMYDCYPLTVRSCDRCHRSSQVDYVLAIVITCRSGGRSHIPGAGRAPRSGCWFSEPCDDGLRLFTPGPYGGRLHFSLNAPLSNPVHLTARSRAEALPQRGIMLLETSCTEAIRRHDIHTAGMKATREQQHMLSLPWVHGAVVGSGWQ